MDGVVDIWDYFYRQNEVAYSHKVGDCGLSSISVQGHSQGGGRLVAVGDVNGTVSLLEVCESLAVQQPNEKAAINSMFERETKREKNLEVRERDLRRVQSQMEEQKDRESAEKKDGKDEKMEELLRKVDADFLAMIKEAEDDESKASEGASLDAEKAEDK
jgi:dynein intermediate chain 2